MEKYHFINPYQSKALDSSRNYQMDNIRSLLIYLTVFGHLLETMNGNAVTTNIYRCIYSFHMPAMIFVSGFFARYRPAVLIRRILFPYILFQIIYLSFDCYILHNQETLKLQFTTPYWLLWYLLALFFYNMLLPLFQTDNWHVASKLLMVCVLISLIAGFDNTIGYYLSLSRILVFFPFYVAGLYCASFSILSLIIRHKLSVAVCTGIMIFSLECLFTYAQIPAKVFYGSLSYNSLSSNGLIRLLFLICAFSWILFLLSVIPHQKIPIITNIGQRTFPIFLLHGFIQRIILKLGLLHGNPYMNMLFAGVITVLTIATLSIQPINNLFRKLFDK